MNDRIDPEGLVIHSTTPSLEGVDAWKEKEMTAFHERTAAPRTDVGTPVDKRLEELATFLEYQADLAAFDDLSITARKFREAKARIQDLNRLETAYRGRIEMLNVPCAHALDELWKEIMPEDSGDWDYPMFAKRHILCEIEEQRQHMELLNRVAMVACVVSDMNEKDEAYAPAKKELALAVAAWRTAIFAAVRVKSRLKPSEE
jgi:hypothetical protein